MDWTLSFEVLVRFLSVVSEFDTRSSRYDDVSTPPCCALSFTEHGGY